ncbi:hypothetical protein RUM44_009833 [Polyplax serrata]|uniref:Sodium channel and clathrin linker 1 n=1 Tax=Polyplax serrata TaxID=468196 RepID=A0ABR1ATV7_POLSC
MYGTRDPKMHSLISEYEDVIQATQIQLQETKEDHRNLKQELLALISENQKLTTKLDLEYKERINDSVDGKLSDILHSELLLNLQKELDLCKSEKKRALELYESSLVLIEKLEQELEQNKENASCGHKNAVSISVSENILGAKLKNTKENLEAALNGRDQAERENLVHKTEIAKLKMSLESGNKLIEDFKIREAEWKEKYIKSEQNYAMLQATYECVVKSRNQLESKMDIYTKNIRELVEKNNEARLKVAEALDVAEKAIVEKDATAIREYQLKEETKRLQLCLEHVIDEAGKKVASEVEETEKKYEERLKTVLKELTEAKSESEKVKEEKKKVFSRYKKLERLTSAKLDKEKINLIKGSETEITILENHLASVYQELERVKLKYDEMAGEKRKSEEKYSEEIENLKSVATSKEEREAYLEETVKELTSQLEVKVDELSESSRRCEFFLGQVRDLQVENKSLRKTAGKCRCEKLRARLQKLNEMRISQTSELESHVESQMKLNETWKEEVKEMTEKFERKIQLIQKECDDLKAKNKKITNELNVCKGKICFET